MQVDCIIVGQGICGTLLSYELVKAGCKVLVIDDAQPYASGRVASGLVNPVTGMRVAKSWMVDELYPVAVQTYADLEQALGTQIVQALNILEFHPDIKHRDTFNDRIPQYPDHLAADVDDVAWADTFNFHYGVGRVTSSFWVNMRALQSAWRTRLEEMGSLREAHFNLSALQVEANGVRYENVSAPRVVFCNGASCFSNPWFERLPFALNKGEALIASIPGLSPAYIYKNGIKITPWEDGLFWVGASFDWKYEDDQPSASFRSRTEAQLHNWLKLPYTIHRHMASIRPATVDHKPFVGFHPLHPALGIFNGMGAKGCLQAPFFAASLAANISKGTPVLPDVDIARFTRILSR
jgi:glycine/D-amino acid oxidase-like deaminating enzyme